MRYLFFILSCCCINNLFAQTSSYAKELSVQIDNDAFLLKIRDGYYSSGLYLRYAAANNTKKGLKRIQTFELGQQMYTPRNKAYAYNNIIDRPYAGYLYLKYAQKTILPKAQQLEWTGALGVVGPAAGAAGFQEWYHNLMNYAFFPGWEKQIPNHFALDASVQYTAAIQPEKNGLARIYPTAQLNLGTTFSNLRTGAYFVLGKAEAMQQTALFNNRIHKGQAKWQHKEEVFVYYYPSITWQWYNATIQGPMGNKPGAPVVTASPSNFLPEHRFGFCYAKNRTTLRVEVVHQGKEATSQTNNQNYGVIGFAYRFKELSNFIKNQCMSTLTFTLLQQALVWEDKTANIQHFSSIIHNIHEHTEVVVLPEMFSTGFSMRPEIFAEKMDGPTVTWMRNTAAEKKIILTGSLMIEEHGQYHNRLIWMLPNGEYGYYDKKHCFGYAGEDKHYTPGSKRLIASVKGWRINLQICYDLRFPVWARQQLHDGPEYDVLLYVANWPERRNHAWKTLLQARAIENQCYVIGVNRVGRDGNDIYHSGDSMVVDAMGTILYEKAHGDDVHTITLEKQPLDDIRSKLPFLKDADPFTIHHG